MTITAFTGDNSVQNRFLKFLPFFVVLGFSLFFTSCFTVETDFLIKKDGSSTTIFTYIVEKDFVSFWEGEKGSGYLLFPVSRRDFEQRTFQVDGATLLSYKVSNKKIDEKEMQVIRAEVLFESPEALNQFFNGDFILKSNSDGGEFKYSLYQPQKEVSPEALMRVLDLVGESRVVVKVKTPSVIKQGSADEEGKTKNDYYEAKIADILTGEASSNITVKW